MTLDQPTAFISAGALRKNLTVIRDRVAPAEVMAVIKDNAYGHGQELVLDVLIPEGVTRFGTLDVPSSIQLRERNQEAMIFAWVIDEGDDVAGAIRTRVDLGITNSMMLERVAEEARNLRLSARVHLKIDSGLHRAGTLPEQWPALVSRAAALQNAGIITTVGVWTHLSEASDAEDSCSIDLFTRAVDTARRAGLDGVERHLAASAAAYARTDARFDMVRVGAHLYGIGPGSGTGAADLGLEPVMTLSAPIIDLHRRDSRHYADIALGGVFGLFSDAAGAVSATIAGQRYPLVSVELTRSVIDISAAVNGSIAAGDTVTLFGSGATGEQTVNEWADAIGTIGEELVCRVAAHLPRVLTS